MAARCGKSKPKPGTPRRGAKFGFSGVPTNGGANPPRNAPGLAPVPRPTNPRPAPEEVRAGAAEACMGAEAPLPCPKAEIEKPALSASIKPNLETALVMAVGAKMPLNTTDVLGGFLVAKVAAIDSQVGRTPQFVRFYAIRIPRGIPASQHRNCRFWFWPRIAAEGTQERKSIEFLPCVLSAVGGT